MPFILPELPFDKKALEPHMSAETLDFHHGKHHKAYVDKANGMIADKDMGDLTLLEVIKKAKDKGDKKLFNNAAQIWNHSFFWQCLAAESADHFGSGWGWLVLDNKKLKVTSLHDADTPAVHDLVPLLTLDVWEHAYYIDYRNERPKFLKTVLENIINWDFVSQNLDGKGLERADQDQKAKADA